MGTVEGKIVLAKDGDSYAARQLLALFHHYVKRRENNPPWRLDKVEIPDALNKYLAECFLNILAGESADESLYLITGLRKRPRLTCEKKQERCRIGYHVSNYMIYEHLSLEDAAEKAAREFNVSPSTAEKAYKSYMVVKTKK
ncbi:MAG: hypothetical protein ABTQ93_01650 [Candidatus Competibacter denitrificans]